MAPTHHATNITMTTQKHGSDTDNPSAMGYENGDTARAQIIPAWHTGAGLILATLGLLIGLDPWSPVLAILGVLGALFFTIGASLATVSIVKTRRSARLLNEGRRLSGEILGVGQKIFETGGRFCCLILTMRDRRIFIAR